MKLESEHAWCSNTVTLALSLDSITRNTWFLYVPVLFLSPNSAVITFIPQRNFQEICFPQEFLHSYCSCWFLRGIKTSIYWHRFRWVHSTHWPVAGFGQIRLASCLAVCWSWAMAAKSATADSCNNQLNLGFQWVFFLNIYN